MLKRSLPFPGRLTVRRQAGLGARVYQLANCAAADHPQGSYGLIEGGSIRAESILGRPVPELAYEQAIEGRWLLGFDR